MDDDDLEISDGTRDNARITFAKRCVKTLKAGVRCQHGDCARAATKVCLRLEEPVLFLCRQHADERRAR